MRGIGTTSPSGSMLGAVTGPARKRALAARAPWRCEPCTGRSDLATARPKAGPRDAPLAERSELGSLVQCLLVSLDWRTALLDEARGRRAAMGKFREEGPRERRILVGRSGEHPRARTRELRCADARTARLADVARKAMSIAPSHEGSFVQVATWRGQSCESRALDVAPGGCFTARRQFSIEGLPFAKRATYMDRRDGVTKGSSNAGHGPAEEPRKTTARRSGEKTSGPCSRAGSASHQHRLTRDISGKSISKRERKR